MIKKWNQFNESKAEKPGENVPGSVKINLSDEDVNAFTDNPSLQKLISDDKVALLGNEVWYWEDDMATKGVMDQYLEIPGKNDLEEITESINQSAKEDLKRQFYELEALSRLDPWDVINVLDEIKKDFL